MLGSSLRRVKTVFLLVGAALLQGCESTHGPIVRNSYDHPIYVRIDTNHRTFDLRKFKPGAALWWREESVQVTRITVYRDSALVWKVGAAELAKQRKSAGTDFIGWSIDESGISGITMEQLLESRSKRSVR